MVTKLIYNVAVLFIMMLPGVILKKCKLSTDGLGKGLSNLVLYIAQPALIFNAYVRPYDSAVLVNAIWVLVFSIIAHVIFTAITLALYKKEPDATRRMLRFATIFSNAAFMGIPLIQEVLGADATIYASIYNITFNAFLWTLGVNICTKDRDIDGDGKSDEAHLKSKGQGSIVKAMLHPTMIAAFLGLFFFFLPIEGYIPEIVTDCLTRLANLVGPLSMVVLGLRLADIDLKGFFKEKSLYIFIALRHVVLPVIIFAIIRVVMIFLSFDSAVLESVLIMASAPAATSATMFAEKYDCDAAYVSKLVAVSTILSLLTMPLIFFLTYI
jgi:predicted permease